MFVRADVTAFHKAPVFTGATVAVVPLDEQKNSLEWSTYADEVGRRLAAAGMVPAPPDQARYIAMFDYSMGQAKHRTASIPTYGQTGVSGANTTGTVHNYGNTSTYSGTTTYTPQYGITGYVPVQYEENTRGMQLMVFDITTGSDGHAIPVYEAKVTSVGSSSNLQLIVPYMIDAVFKEFPGPTGKTRSVTMPMTK